MAAACQQWTMAVLTAEAAALIMTIVMETKAGPAGQRGATAGPAAEPQNEANGSGKFVAMGSSWLFLRPLKFGTVGQERADSGA